MPLDLWIAIAVLLAALFYAVGYALNIKKDSEKAPEFVYIDVIYFIGSLFFVVYAGLRFYEAVNYPQSYKQSL